MRLEDFEVIIQWQWDTEKEKNTLRLKSNVNPLIRCKDCKHKPYLAKRKFDGVEAIFRPLKENPEYEGEEDMTCPFLCDDCYYDRVPLDDFFCAYGEAKDD